MGSALLILIYAIWAGYCWTLRGGGFGALCRSYLGFEPGTTITRIATALLIAAPLTVAAGWWALAVWPALYVAMTLGYFKESMGVQDFDEVAWMSVWGVVVLLIASFPFIPSSLPFAAAGALVGPIYLVNKRVDPNGHWTQTSEFCTGFAFGLALYLGASA